MPAPPAHLWFGATMLAAAPFLMTPGCTPVPVEPLLDAKHVESRWLPAIQDAQTPLASLASRLGEPPERFEPEHVVGYRLVLVESENEVPVALPWTSYAQQFGFLAPYREGEHAARIMELEKTGVLSVVRSGDHDRRPFRLATRAAEYTLVLSVDPAGIITQHTLHRVWP